MIKKSTLIALSVIASGIATANTTDWQRVPTEMAQSQHHIVITNAQKISRVGSESRPMNVWQSINPVKQYTEKSGINIYGYSCNDIDYTENGLISFNSATPSEITRFNVSDDVTAGAYGDKAYYVMRTFQYFYPGALCTVDLTTGEVTEVASYIENADVRLATEMSYDVTTETMYMIFNSDDDIYSTAFGTVDLKTGEQVVINPNMNRYVRAMAINMDGVIYAIDQDGYLLTIDKMTGECTNLFEINCIPFYRQTMEFDRNTGELYWAYRDPDTYSYLKKVDINTGAIVDLGSIGDGAECMVGMYIPYSICDDAAPAKVSNFSLTADPQGQLSATLSWTCPTLTYAGDPLSSIDNVSIYRDGQLIATLQDAEPGNTMTYTDTPSEDRLYTYKVVAVNSQGTGAPVNATVFVGHDLPNAVKITSVKRLGTSGISLQWEAPTAGINNGYIDTESLRYNVTRLTDGKVLANNLTETSFTDNDITQLNRYRYQITVSNIDGVGGVTKTGYIVNGPARSLPLEADFNNDAEAKLWSIGDANRDGVYWFWQHNSNENRSYYFYQTEWEKDADDWLISPLTTFESGKIYKMEVEAMPSNTTSPEKIEFYLVQNYDISTAIKVGETFDVVAQTDSNGKVILSTYRALINNIESGDYSVAIRCVSSAWDGYWIAVANVLVCENMDGNLRGDVWDDYDEPVEGVTVSLQNTEFSTTTDKNGQFEISNIPEGEYTVVTSKLGYKDCFKKVNISMLETTNAELDIIRRKEFNVSGVVRNEYGEPIANSSVTLTGYNNYSTTTDAEGRYSFSGVYENDKSYSVKASKDFYNESKKSISVFTADATKDLTLTDQIVAPAMANASIADNLLSSNVAWTKPGYEAQIKHHSASGSYSFGTDEGDATTLIGVICKRPVILESMAWTTYCDSESINIVVLALDQNGNATNNVLYIDEDAKNQPFYQTTYSFDSPIYAENGCFIGLSIDTGNLSLLTAENTAEYPFIEGVNAYIECYTDDTTLNFVEDLGNDYRENFFINYQGMILADQEAPKTLFNIYRIDANNNATLLNDQQTADLSFVDSQWPYLDLGNYSYAVEAIYANGKVSERTLTQTLNQSVGIENIITDDDIKAIEIYSTNGLKLATVKEASAISLPDGIYIARMLVGNNWISKKLLISNAQ